MRRPIVCRLGTTVRCPTTPPPSSVSPSFAPCVSRTFFQSNSSNYSWTIIYLHSKGLIICPSYMSVLPRILCVVQKSEFLSLASASWPFHLVLLPHCHQPRLISYVDCASPDRHLFPFLSENSYHALAFIDLPGLLLCGNVSLPL